MKAVQDLGGDSQGHMLIREMSHLLRLYTVSSAIKTDVNIPDPLQDDLECRHEDGGRDMERPIAIPFSS